MTRPATDALHAQERGSAVQSLHRRGVTFVPLRPIPGLACGADIVTRQLPGLGLQSGTVWGNRHEHTHADAGRGNDDLSIHINLSGLSIVAGRGREMTLQDGDAVLLSYSEARTVTRPGRVHHRIVRLPRASLVPLVPNIDDAVLRPIPRGAGALTLLANYAGALIDDPAIVAPQMRQLVVAQLCDLIAVTLGVTRGAQALADGRGSVPRGSPPSRSISKRIWQTAICRPPRSRRASGFRTATSASCSKARGHRFRNSCCFGGSRARIAC